MYVVYARRAERGKESRERERDGKGTRMKSLETRVFGKKQKGRTGRAEASPCLRVLDGRVAGTNFALASPCLRYPLHLSEYRQTGHACSRSEFA